MDAAESVKKRVPLPRAVAAGGPSAPAANPGKVIPGLGKPSQAPGDWPQFRGANRDNIAPGASPAAAIGPINPMGRIGRSWPKEGPKVLWRVAVGEGFAAAAVHQSRVYVVDYDREKEEDAIRCLSLDDGAEIWRYTYSASIKRNHGMSRTIPAVTDRFVVSLGPKCNVRCLDAVSGALVWKKDLVEECETVVPPWYAGQCPLLDGDRVILAPAAKPLMMAVELATGREMWRTKENEGAGMTHTSITPMTFHGRKQFIYSAQTTIFGVDGENGNILWSYPQWKKALAYVPSPLAVGEDRVFLTFGYGAGSVMLRLKEEGGAITAEEVFRLAPQVFGCDQQTPILYENHIYGVRGKEEMVCLDLDGAVKWASKGQKFGLGPYMIADGLLLALNDADGTLLMAEASPVQYKELARAKLLKNQEAWGPMAIAGGRLILRDVAEMICVDVGQ